jgi:hypothetical protein
MSEASADVSARNPKAQPVLVSPSNYFHTL